jgi:hypothetical protein
MLPQGDYDGFIDSLKGEERGHLSDTADLYVITIISSIKLNKIQVATRHWARVIVFIALFGDFILFFDYILNNHVEKLPQYKKSFFTVAIDRDNTTSSSSDINCAPFCEKIHKSSITCNFRTAICVS